MLPRPRNLVAALICCLAAPAVTAVTLAAPPGPSVPPPAPLSPADAERFFETSVRPVLLTACGSCHGPEKQSAGLRVDSREALLKGGLSGPALVPGKAEESLLWQAVAHRHPRLKMPPSGKLPERQVADLARWIAAGAPWPAAAARAGAGHWAFQPVKRPAIPRVRNHSWVKTPVDAFILADLEKHGLQPAPPADRRTLLRRATFDLTGLPPTPEETDAFLADRSPNAWEKVVDRLLASPAYGERWGRHWLDVVRYADTAGETADFPAPQAWRYRNYVIAAFNADKPYDRFLKEQIAGDLLARESGLRPEQYAECVTATGYLAIARRFGFDSTADHYLTLEDTIDTLGKSVLGLTLGCARCHDHKYDPISAADYYGLYGIFDSTRYAFPGCEKEKQPRDLVPLLPPAEVERRKAQERGPLEREVAEAEPALAAARAEVARLSGQSPMLAVHGDVPEGGSQDLAAGSGGSLDAIPVRRGDFIQLTVLPRGNHGADSTGVELEIREQGGEGRTWNVARDVLAERERWNGTAAFGPGPTWLAYDMVPAPVLFTRFSEDAGKPGLVAWRGAGSEPLVFLNTRAEDIPYFNSRMPARSFAVHPGPKGGVGLAWQSPLDGVVSVRGRISDLHPAALDGVAWVLEHRPGFAAALPRVSQLSAQLDRARERLAALDSGAWVDRAYAVTDGTPHNARIQRRGEPKDLGPEVPRKFPDRLGGMRVQPDGTSGRLQLAGWLTSPSNPLTARVIVNRVWQGHFTRGLVGTPNDFGTRGLPPTHPALLDWLASCFTAAGPRRGAALTASSQPGLGWSLKSLHRLLMRSSTYRMSSGGAGDARSEALLARFPRRRLSAEEIRDSLLACSGDLDPTPGGAHPFPPESQWGFTQHGPFLAVYETNRRSVYLMTQRIRRHPFLALFDGADPSSSTPERMHTTVPTQALFFMNDPFLHTRADSLARRLLAASTEDAARVDRAFRLLYARPPAEAERSEALAFLRRYESALPGGTAEERRKAAWAAYARVLFSSSEFIYID